MPVVQFGIPREEREIESKFLNCLMHFSAPSHQSPHSIFYFCESSILLVFHISILLVLQSKEKKRYAKWRTEEAEWRAGDGSGGGDGRRGLQSSHQWAAMTGCHSCQELWEIFCQGKANSSSFSPNRPVRPSEQGGDVVSLELRALFKTAALRLPHATCNKGPSVRHRSQLRELMTGFTAKHQLGLRLLCWSWE